MKPSGIFVTEEERQVVLDAQKCSGIWLSGGSPLGDPCAVIATLVQRYNMPAGAGLMLSTGQFHVPDAWEAPALDTHTEWHEPVSDPTIRQWHYQEKSDAYTHIVRTHDGKIVVSLPQDTSGKAESDARFIAAAPDMEIEIERLKEVNAALLHALTEVRGFMGDVSAPEYYWEVVKVAIAKAEHAP